LPLPAPLAGLGVRQAIRSNANDVRDWLPAHYAETRDYRWFRQYFGNEDSSRQLARLHAR
jgi:hypothetical protein